MPSADDYNFEERMGPPGGEPLESIRKQVPDYRQRIDEAMSRMSKEFPKQGSGQQNKMFYKAKPGR